MSNYFNQTGRNLLALVVVLTFFGGIITACRSSGDENRVGQAQSANAATPTINSNAAVNTSAETKKVPTAAKQTDGLPEFKKGENYKTSVRVKMLKDGWQPARTEDADLCGSGDSTCDEFPEMENCAGTGLGNCKFRWQKDGKIAAIFTVGDPKIYDSSEYEKASKTTAASPDKKWQAFWTEFKTGFDKQDAPSLRKLMADDFFDGGGGGTASQWLDSIKKNNSWAMNRKSIAAGTETGKCDNPCRTTKDGYLVFEYRNGKWLWTALGGEGGDD